MLTKRSWHPESLLWLGCILMVTLGLVGGLAGNFKDGSVEQMAANVAVLPLSILVSVISWMLISANFYNTPIGLKDTFGLNRGRVKTCLAFGLGGGVVIIPVAMFLMLLTSFVVNALADEAPEGQKLVTVIAEQAQAEGGLEFLIFFAFMAVVVAPIGEEILFRGILYPSIKQNGYPKVAIFGTAVLFGLFHVNLLTFASLTFVGLALIFIYEKTDNLLAPILAHAFFNAVNVYLILMASKGIPDTGMIQ